MQPEQKIIAGWMIRTQERIGLSWAEWARKAKVGAATTLTRAIKDDYKSVTSIPTLDALAKAAGERSVLDFLSERSPPAEPEPPRLDPDTIAPILGALLPAVDPDRLTDPVLRALSGAFAYGLELLGDQSTSQASPDAIAVAARGAVSRFRELGSA